MRHLALFTLALLAAADVEARDRRCYSRGDRNGECASYAFFEAFPTSGAGTSGACSTTAPTGARGEALTFTRASSGTCTKTASGGLATTGIANGDLVSLSTNQPRVEYDSNGVLGLRVEAARTNVCLQNQALDGAPWVQENGGPGAPTVTANAATAPDGTLTADRVQYPATSAAQFSGSRQQVTIAGGTNTLSAYVRGTSGSGTIDLCVQTGTYACSSCAFVSTSWTRCSVTGAQPANPLIYIGNMSSVNGGTARSANDVLVWGAQAEAGAYATSYIAATSAAVTRAAETATFPVSFTSWPVSWAATVTGGAAATGKTGYFLTYGNSTSIYGISQSNGATTYNCAVANTSSASRSTTIAGYGSSFRAGCYSTASEVNTVFNGTSGTPQAHAISPFTNTTVYVGGGVYANQQIDSIFSRLCIDPDPTRCR